MLNSIARTVPRWKSGDEDGHVPGHDGAKFIYGFRTGRSSITSDGVMKMDMFETELIELEQKYNDALEYLHERYGRKRAAVEAQRERYLRSLEERDEE